MAEWRFKRQGDDVDVRVTLFDNWTSSRAFRARPVEPPFQMRCPLVRLAGEVLDELWRVQETVGIDGYQERWKMHAFPLQEYTQLRYLLRERTMQRQAPRGNDPRP